MLSRRLNCYIRALYYSEIHSENIKIYLSKLCIGTYYEVHDIIKYTQKTSRLLIVLMAGALLIMSRVQACDEGGSLSTPALVSFAFLTAQRKKKEDILKDEKKHHGAVDESSSEQQFHKSDAITFVV